MDFTTAQPLSASSPNNPRQGLTQYVAALAQPAERERAAQLLAQLVGAEDLVIFIRDQEIGELLPALGFPQTFPQGRKWRSFLDLVLRAQRAEASLPMPRSAMMTTACGIAYDDQAVLVLLGGNPIRADVHEVALYLPLLVAAFQGELSIKTATAQAMLARNAVAESQLVGKSLELARQELQQALHQTRLTLNHNEELNRQLAGQAAELRTILEAIPDAILACDVHGIITRINAQGRDLFDLDIGDSILSLGSKLLVFKEPRGAVLLTTVPEYLLAQAMQTNRLTDLRCVLRKSELLPEHHLLLNAVSIRMREDVTGVVFTATDITHIHHLSEMKDEFLAIASHELRTPLTTIKMMTQVAQRRTARAIPVEMQHFEQISHAVLRMERLVSDLLDVSRVQSGKLSLNLILFDLCALCRQATSDEQFGEERPIAMNIPSGPINVWGDPLRITQVIVNFLTNANKYSQAGSPITITLHAVDSHVRVAVSDAGIGIPPQDVPHVFERFFRVPTNTVQNGSRVGLGLGLYICRTIIEMHQGQIGVDSTVGDGSTFWFTLPLAA